MKFISVRFLDVIQVAFKHKNVTPKFISDSLAISQKPM